LISYTQKVFSICSLS